MQAKLPIWIGGGGEKRTLRIAAHYADGWNVPFVAPEQFARKRDVLASTLRRRRARPGEIRCAVNVGLAWTEEIAARSVRRARRLRASGRAVGISDEVVERIGQYVEAGADQVNLALRAPFDVDALEQFAAALALADCIRMSELRPGAGARQPDR